MKDKRYAKLAPLIKSAANLKSPKDLSLDEVAKSVARGIEQAHAAGTFECHVLDANAEEMFRVELLGDKAQISKMSAKTATFSVRTSQATLADIAKGEFSPVDAYLQGRMEVHGDLDFGRRLFAKLAAKTGQTEF